ncbi:hypothetical protein CR969_01315 [Candidatus Saccharibacteria bacterium]|nr:MAG: hypothetical protein CR969_01315 [Candidatus Saccharibacteria bacterium]
MRTLLKTLIIILSIPTILMIALFAYFYWWPALTFPSYATKQLDLKKGSLSQINMIRKNLYGQKARDLVLIAEIKPEVRDALLKKKLVFNDCYSPCSGMSTEDRRHNISCNTACDQEALKLFDKNNDLAKYIVKGSVGSGDVYCASRHKGYKGGGFRRDLVCLSPDSTKIRYSSYEPDF